MYDFLGSHNLMNLSAHFTIQIRVLDCKDWLIYAEIESFLYSDVSPCSVVAL